MRCYRRSVLTLNYSLSSLHLHVPQLASEACHEVYSIYHLILTGQSGANRQAAAGDAGLKE